MDSMGMKNLEHYIKHRQMQKAADTPEEEQHRCQYQKSKEIEAVQLKKAAQTKQYRKKQREEEKSILKKAKELLIQNQLSIEEREILTKAEEVKALRLRNNEYQKRYMQKRKAAATPEEMEAMRLKNLEYVRSYQLKQKAAATAEKMDARRLKLLERMRKYRREKREREESILRQAMELLRQNQELSSDEKEVLRLAQQIKANRLKGRERVKQLRIKKTTGRLTNDQVFDEIKIEKEVLQETTIKAISKLQHSNSFLDMRQGGYNDSSCSWLELSEKSRVTGETSQNHSYFQSFHGDLSSIQLDRRKLGLEKHFRCMRVLIDATAKCDGKAIFGKQIAEKLRSSKKNVAEFNIAKKLIDDILQNLAIGAYSYKT